MRTAAIVLSISAALVPSLAGAQFANLPREDFIWRWAHAADEAWRIGPEDFEVRGGEAPFQCVLTGKLSPGSHLTEQDLRDMQYQLQGSLFFVQESANMMNELDIMRDLDWAVLDCKRPQAAEEDPAEVQEKVDRAREKAIEDMLRRRERAQQ